MTGLNDSYFLADDSMEPNTAKAVTLDVFKDSTSEGEEPELRDDVDLIAVGMEDIFVRLRDMELLEENIRTQGGMNKNIALEAHALMPEFLNDDRPLEFFTKTPSRTLLAAAMEDIGAEKKSMLVRLLEAVQAIIKSLYERVKAFFESRQEKDLENFSAKTKQPMPKAISWVKVARDAGIELPTKEEAPEAAPAEAKPEVKEHSKTIDNPLPPTKPKVVPKAPTPLETNDVPEYMESDEARKKAINALGDKLFVKLGEASLKRLAFTGDAKSKAPTAYVDFVMSNLERARNIDLKSEELKKFADEVTEVVNSYRQEEAGFELAAATQTARDIVGDMLYHSEHGYYKEQFKFKGATVSFKSSFMKLLERLTEATAHIRANSATEEDIVQLQLYQHSLMAFNQLFKLHQEFNGSLDMFLKLRKQYFTSMNEE